MSKDELTSLLKKIPNLTIFIPALPEDFFFHLKHGILKKKYH